MAIGLDWGTSTVIACRNVPSEEDPNRKVPRYRKQRNCYVPMSATDEMKNWLREGKMNFVEFDGDSNIYVIGEHAIQLASSLNVEVKRPMKAGTMQGDAKATGIMKAIAGSVLGEPKEDREICVFSVPSDPIDVNVKTFYHEGITKMSLMQLGWDARPIKEALAIIYSEAPKMTTDSGEEAEFTGIGVSCGGGMINVCVAFRGIPTISFSLADAYGMGEGCAGDWVDNQIFKQFQPQFGTVARCTLYKERFSNFTKNPFSDVDYVTKVASESNINSGQIGWHAEVLSSIQIFYEHLLDYTIAKIASEFEAKRPTLEGALQIVVGGGTAMPEGFDILFADRVAKHSLPFKVAGVNRAANSINAVARGCLVAGEVGFGG